MTTLSMEELESFLWDGSMEIFNGPDPACVLPPSLPPRGLSRVQGAAYVGVSPTLFDEMVSDGRMPKPKRANNRTIWDRLELDEAFAALPSEADANPWDEAVA